MYEELKALVRRAQFEGSTVRNLSHKLRVALPSKIDLRDGLSIESLVLLAEIYDYYGQFTASGEISTIGKDLLAKLPSRPCVPSDKITQAKVRLVVAYARSLYRQSHYSEAESLLHDCRNYVTKYIKSSTFPNLGTLGEIAYTLGRVHRQQQRYDAALQEFNTAIQLYDERAVKKHEAKAESFRLDEAFSIHKVATIISLGRSWCNYTRGMLSAALFGNLIPARMLLRDSGDVLNRAYADVIFASVTRALAGKDNKKLLSAYKLVAEAQKVFMEYGHQHYTAGAALELALISLAQDNIESARRHLQTLRDSSAPEDVRWQGSALIIQSRILRREGDYPRAQQIATKAFHLARNKKERLAQIDALIARSEAYGTESRKHDLAIADLVRALKVNKTAGEGMSSFNPKVHAICHLHLADHFLLLKRTPDARASFAEWEKVCNVVEHAAIHQFAARIAPKLNRLGILSIDVRQQGLIYDEHENRLRAFLLNQATMRKDTQGEIAALLGISRTTLDKWQGARKKTK